MDSKFAQRCLPLLLALVMVLSLTPIPALALEAEDTVPAEPEELPTESSAEVEISVTIEDIQNRINTLLDFFGITAEMTDNEIANAIIEADSDTVNTTKVAIDAIESDAQNFTENEIMCLDTILYGRFCAVFDRLFAPAPIASVTVLDGLLSITDSKSRISVSGGTVTATAKGSTIYRSQNDLTFTNESGSKATLTFDYSISGYDSHSFPEDSGTYTAILDAGASVTQYIIAPRFNKTVTLTMNNFSLVAVAATSEVTFEFDSSKGSVTVDGTAITSGDKRSLSADTGAILVATPKSTDYTFLGWINKATGKIQDTPDGKFIATESMTLKAVFVAKASDTGWFLTSGTHLFDNLTNANNHAKNASNKTIVLANNGTLSGSHEISSGVTLLIPFDSANTLYTTAPATVDEYIKPTAYRTLTMADGAVITVRNGGAVSVSGKHSAKMNSYNGSPTGPQGSIVMNEGSNITVEGNGTLYAWGYIVGEARSSNDTVPTGGSVTIKSSGKVYECFQVTDYRGGSATSDMASAWGSNVRTYHVFPMSQYYVQNVQVPMTLHSNATETGYFSVNATGVGLRSVSVPFIGSTGMFRINSGYIVKDYDEQSDRLLIDIHGNLEMASIQLSIPGALGISIDIDSNDYVLPLTNNMTATLHSGYALAITQDLAILPGAVLNVEENATVTVGTSSAKKSIYVYDAAQWGGYCGEYDKTIIPLSYAYDRLITCSADALTDATVLVNGTIDATNGYAYTTTDGANIYSTGAGKIIAGAAGTNTVTYQVTQGQGNTSLTNVEIPITPAKLKHEDGSYLDTSSGTYNHDHYTCEHGDSATHGVWYAGSHGTATAADLPTYQKTGNTATCTCGHGGDVLPKVVQQAAIAASADSEIILDVKFWLPDTVTSVSVVQQCLENKVLTTAEQEYTVANITKDSKATGAYIDGNGRYVFSRAVASGEMTCPITFTFKDENGNVVQHRSGEVFSDSLERSVVDYAKLVLENGTDQQKALITNLLTYGGYSQVKFGVDADNPAYKLLEEKDIGVPDVANTAISVTESDTVTAVSTITGSITGLTVSAKNQAYLDSAIYFRLYFTLTEGSTEDYSVSYRLPVGNCDTVAVPLEIKAETNPDTGNIRYYVDIPDIPSGYLDYPYKVTFRKGNETLTMQTSVLAYLKRLVDSPEATTDMKNLAKAMYLYNQTANTFFNK